MRNPKSADDHDSIPIRSGGFTLQKKQRNTLQDIMNRDRAEKSLESSFKHLHMEPEQETRVFNPWDQPKTWSRTCFQEADPVQLVLEKNILCSVRHIRPCKGSVREPEKFYSQHLFSESSKLLPDSRWKEKEGKRPRGVNEINARSRGNWNHTQRL